jgi:flagellar biosynthesis protein
MADYGEKDENQHNFKPLKPKGRSTAVAIKDGAHDEAIPIVKAAARGALADKILEIAQQNDIKIREDADLAELLAELELESPIPTEALMAVAEILSYVYRANGQPDPFNAIAPESDDKESSETT